MTAPADDLADQSRSGRPWRPSATTVLVTDASVLLAARPARRARHRPLLARCWELRDHLTLYDVAYVALAEALDAVLLTGDQRLSRAPGPRCPMEIFQPAP